jgi:GNAT superfamily N-acetyltransferase
MSDPEFEKIWTAYIALTLNTFTKRVEQTPSANIYLSDIPGTYHNYAIPTVDDPNDFNLVEVTKTLKLNGRSLSIYLSDKHRRAGFTEYLIRKGCKYHGTDSWVVLDTQIYEKYGVSAHQVIEVTSSNFSDFADVESACFPNFPGNPDYIRVSKETIDKENGDIQSKFYVVYENHKPVACGGLLYSAISNVAYLHGAGTLASFRNKGYQTALIRHRVGIALENGISIICSSVEPGSTSWSNCIKVGFYEAASYLTLN